MGCFKIGEIEKDIDKTTKEIGNLLIFDLMKIIAKVILKKFSDNRARDMAISNLLETANFLRFCIIEEAAKNKADTNIRNYGGEAQPKL